METTYGMTGRPQATIEQQHAVERYVLEGHSAAAIYRLLKSNGLLDDPHPELHKRTIERMVRRLTPEDTSDPWSAMDEPEQARFVLDVAAYVFNMSQSRVWLTKNLAQWIARVRTVDPETPPHFAYVLARSYQSARTVEEFRNLDLELDAKPWKILSEDTSNPMAQYLGTMDGWRDRNLRNLAFHGQIAASSD
jgi:hypothetical protein